MADSTALEWLVPAMLALAMAWKLVCVALRNRRARYMASFSPVEDAYTVRRFTQNVEFPYLSHTSLEFALFRTYAIPSISKILAKTGSFQANALKRADDTEILNREMFSHHVDSDRGSAALRRLNFIHGHYQISNDDFLYVLALFILEPYRWVQRYGYRDMTTAERVSCFVTWRDIGVRMGIKGIPEDYDELERWQVEYEVKKMTYADSNRLIADTTVALLIGRFPTVTHPVLRHLVFAILDDPLRVAFGYPEQPKWLQYLVRSLLKFCTGTCIALFHPPRPLAWSVDRISIDVNEEGANFLLDRVRKLSFHRWGCAYPNGYKVAEVGPFKPGVLGKPCEGQLLCPLSDRYFDTPWPPQ